MEFIVEDRDIEKGIKLLKYLGEGQRVTVKGRTYALGENGGLVLIGESLNTETGEKTECYLGNDMPLSHFFRLARELDDEQLFVLGANSVLRDFNSKK